jgi:predicted small secreted protein
MRRKNRNSRNKSSDFKMNLTAAVMVAALLVAGCEIVNGSGDIERRNRAVSAFTRVEIDISADVTVRQGNQPMVSIETDNNLFRYVRTYVRSGTLYISQKEDIHIHPTRLVIEVSTPSFTGLALDGSADVLVADDFEPASMQVAIDGSGYVEWGVPLHTPELNIAIDGAGTFDGTVVCDRVLTDIDGSGDVFLRGSAGYHAISVDGSAYVQALEMETEATDVEVDGTANCYVSATQTLDVWIDGVADVTYRGEPRVTRDIDGSGSVRPL